MDKPLIILNNIIKTYTIESTQSLVLDNISLTISRGDMVALVGASGSGKSTLMNIIGLLDKADSGQYFLDDKEIAALSEDDAAVLRNQKISFVFQQFNLLPRFSALQNVALPLTYRSLSPTNIEAAALNALKQVNMHAYAKHKPTQLSGGQQQRIAIARALVTNPTLILADEPTGALDSKTGHEVMDLFLKLHQEGCTILMVTHDARVAAHCQHRISIVDGQIRAES